MADAARGSVIRGEWSSPEGVRLILADYAARWIRERQLQQPRTRELYESKLWNHINPYLGSRALDKINAQTIRTWRQCLLDEGRSPNRGSKVVPALRAVLNTALKEDRLISRNPRRIGGYDKRRPQNRRSGSVSGVVRRRN